MNTTLSQETAQRVIEILSDLHDEQVGNPEFAAEIDALCGMLQPQPSLYTVIFQSEDGYFFEKTVRTTSPKMAWNITTTDPGLPSMEGDPITTVVHGEEHTMHDVSIEHPLQHHEYVYYRDPDDDVASGLYRVAKAPHAPDPDEVDYGEEGLAEAAYANSVVTLVRDEESAVEAYVHEVRRRH